MYPVWYGWDFIPILRFVNKNTIEIKPVYALFLLNACVECAIEQV